ncbi:MAG: hydroxyphenylacetyl-CoA thioesterase PaaI [Rhodospirillaceae bacterium]
MPNQAKAQRIAEGVREAMYSRDHAAQGLGIEVVEIGPGSAKLTMTVTKNMVNGHDILHGGLCFTLCDTAFAYCCNSHNFNTVAHSCSITFTNAGKLGDVLTAEAVETYQKGRNGVTDVTVRNQDGVMIGMFRGNSRRIAGHVCEHPEFEVPAVKDRT